MRKAFRAFLLATLVTLMLLCYFSPRIVREIINIVPEKHQQFLNGSDI